MGKLSAQREILAKTRAALGVEGTDVLTLCE